MPERQLTGGMQMKSSAQRPGLDQPPSFPELLANVCLGEPVDTHRELELRRGLNLRVYAAKIANDLDEPISARAIGQRGTGQPTCTNVVPSRRDHRRGSCLPLTPRDNGRSNRLDQSDHVALCVFDSFEGNVTDERHALEAPCLKPAVSIDSRWRPTKSAGSRNDRTAPLGDPEFDRKTSREDKENMKAAMPALDGGDA